MKDARAHCDKKLDGASTRAADPRSKYWSCSYGSPITDVT